MNGKIRELAKLAGIAFVYEYDSSIVGDVEDLEKFAELIIKECLVVVDEYEMEYDISDLPREIKEHFGLNL